MRTTLLLCAALAIGLGAATSGPVVAQDASNENLKTVLTVSVAGYDTLMKSVDALAEAAGVPEMAALPKMMLGGSEGPDGLDGSKPLGLVVRTNGQEFPAVLFAPITDTEEFLNFLKRFVPEIPEPGADGVYEVEAGPQTVFIQQKDGWAFATIDKALLADTPADPEKLLGGLGEGYIVAIQGQVANIPKPLRDSAMTIMQMAAASGSQQNEGETDEQYALRQKMTQQSMEGIQKAADEMDSLTIGLGVDATDGTVNLDIAVTAVEGTSLANDMAEIAGLKSAFNGFFSPRAALTFRATSKLSETDVTQALQMIEFVKPQAKKAIEEGAPDEEQARQAVEILNELLVVLQDTIKGRTADAGMSLIGSDAGIALIVGIHIVNATKLEEVFKKVVDKAKEEEPDIDQFLKMNAAEHKGVRFHTLAVPAALVFDDGAPPAYANSDIKITIGFGDSAVYLAHGSNPVKLLKAAIDRSDADQSAEVSPMQLSLSAKGIGSLLEVIATSEDADIPPEVIEILKQAGDKDHLTITAKAIPNGMKSSVTLEGGALRVIGAAAKAAGVAQ